MQCPQCLSTSVARILYGLPAFTPELEEQLEKGEVHLGGCVISDDDPEYHCNGCGHEFYIEMSNSTQYAPDSFEAFIGGYMGESYSIQWKQGKLVYEHFARGYEKEDTTEIEVSAKDWQRFRATLDRLSVWKWDARYETLIINDGDNIGWTTTIGNWGVLSGHNEATGLSGKQAYTYAGNPLWTDYTFDVDITFGTSITEFYVAVRADPTSILRVDGGRQYLLSVDADNDIIRLRYTTSPAGSFNLQTTPYSLLEQTTYHMQISMIGNNIQASIDGNALFDYTFSGTNPIYSKGLVGIGYGGHTEGPDGAFFDNVLVTGPEPIPEPSSLFLFILAIGGILGYSWRRHNHIRHQPGVITQG